MNSEQLLTLFDRTKIPNDWKLCCVKNDKKPYHPQQKFLSNQKPDPQTPTWTEPIERDLIRAEIEKSQCQAIGLLTGEISDGIVAIDCDGSSCDRLIEDLSGTTLEKALPKTVKFTSGKDGRSQALYKIPKIFWDYIKFQKISTGVEQEQVEFRWNGNQSVIMGTHPETGQYNWCQGYSPQETQVKTAPFWIIRQMLSFCHLLPKDKNQWSDRDRAIYFLKWILNQDLDWYKWRNILFALHHSQVQENIARIWSKSSEKHDDKGFDNVWSHIKDECHDPITVKTLAQMAKDHGCKDERNLDFVNAQEDDFKTEIEELVAWEQLPKPSLLPHKIDRLINDLARKMNLPVEVYVCILLSIFASLLNSKTRLIVNESTNHIVPPILWLMLVGESGTKKTAVVKVGLEPLKLMQQEAEEEYIQRYQKFESNLARWEAKPKTERGAKPSLQPPHEFYLTDFTIEVLAQVIKDRASQGLLIYSEELRAFIEGMDAYRGGKGGDRAKWLNFYDGGEFKVNRKITGRVSVPQSSIMILGGIQPSVLQQMFQNDRYFFDGFWSRFACCKIPLTRSPFIIEGEKYVLTSELKPIYQKLSAIKPKEYRFSKEAKYLWKIWHDEMESSVIETTSEAIRTLYPKTKERAARIALICHLVNNAINNEVPSIEIPVETLQQAIDFTRWLLGQSLLTYAEIGIADNPQSPKILSFIGRFRNCGWIDTKKVRNWWSARKKPSYALCRQFMNQIVDLGYAESNGENINSPKYAIKITSHSNQTDLKKKQ